MVPVLIGAAALAAGVALLKDDDKPAQAAPEKERRVISESTLKERLRHNGRQIKTIEQKSAPAQSGLSDGFEF